MDKTYTKYKLNNGLRLVMVPMNGVASVTAIIMVAAGSRYEEKEINGLSHFLEHMAFKGTRKRPTALSISSLIDGIGGEFNAFTTKDHTGYYIKAAAKHLPLVMDVLSDMLLHSKFDSDEIEREKGVIIEEINMYDDLPIKKISDLYENLLYRDTKLGRDIAGIKEVIKNIKRKDFLDYTDRFYSPGNTIVGIAGGIGEIPNPKSQIPNKFQFSKSQIQNIAGQYLGKWDGKKIEKYEKVDDGQREPGLLVRYKDTNQAHLCLGVRAYKLGHPKRYALGLLTAILGGGMSSRLFIQVRERRGLAYYVRSSTEQYQDVGNFVSQAGVDVGRIDDAIRVILEEYARIRDVKVGEKELLKAKEYLKGRLTLELEDSKSVAALFIEAELMEGKIRTPEEIMREVDKVTTHDIMKVAGEIFTQNKLNLAVIGPYKEEGRFGKLLKI